jgi:CRP-like cAMP-binding protein
MRKVLYIFGLLTDADAEWMARTGRKRHLTDREIVIQEGVPTDSVILLLEGAMRVSAHGFGDVGRIGVGEIIGEVSLVDSAPPSATVTAEGECLALFIDKTRLKEKLASDIAFGCRFYRALAVFLADRLRSTRRLPSADGGLADEGAIVEGELDLGIMDNVSSAGERFVRMLNILRS